MRTDELAAAVIAALTKRSLTACTAESCTGGGVGHALTAISGSSAAYLGGVISYTNEVKNQLLGVPKKTLEQFGAVSAETARAMCEGVRRLVGADFGVSITGLAGPNGDGSGKPVGLVYIGCSGRTDTVVEEFVFDGNRSEIRLQALDAALQILLSQITKTGT